MTVCKYHISKKTGLFIGLNGFHDGFDASCKNLRRIVDIQEQGTKAIPMVAIGTMVYFKPSLVSEDGSSTGSDTFRIPHVRTNGSDAFMFTPVNQVGRFGQPDIVPSQ